ncbi:MAG: DUF4173 domain-containing protein [Gemmatimonadetes bacterium]|nr:DUF4173 domain-containing protein [Gemmatimonadota bacterium]MBK6778246.1 DUF4173 domain-containing protein [Gemmatimonadota bacterium]MBK7349444.1 DUF4173 domain-containing protein [Gemmatimonadota bacterium]MBK7716457.1 DUF4173 domain-containing protein [Gemmatimonadota bacterium]MBK7784074.1 DUF4173 domain-containing protein [Gemmatimonadota bacterium]
MTAPIPRDRALLWPVLLLGVLGDLLFRAGELGLNVTLWLWLAAGLWYHHRRTDGAGVGPLEGRLLLGVVAVGFAWIWRASEMLRLLDTACLLVVAALLPLAAQAGHLADLTVGRLLRAGGVLGWRGATGALPVLFDAQRDASAQGGGPARVLLPVARGALLAVPALLVFGGLLTSADPVFGDFLGRLVRFRVDVAMSHVLGTALAAWIGAGFLRGALPGATRWVDAPLPVRLPTLGPVEVGMTVGLVDLLFASFVVFQLPYFFGGAAWVQQAAGVTLADYARRGFFELVALSALVLPLLLLVSSRLEPGQALAQRMYRWLAGAQVVLVLVIMASAAHRMALYQAEFGLTEDRFFASALMAGLAVSALWFAATVLRGRPTAFARGALLSWGVWLFTLNVVNPERVIAETNVRRRAETGHFDVEYLTRLGPDAAPALVAALPRLTEWERGEVRRALEQRFGPETYPDARAWDLGTARARAAVASLTPGRP